MTSFDNLQGKIRGKKLQSLVAGISQNSKLGPYSGGSYTSASGLTVNLEPISLQDLKPGLNDNKVIIGRVVGSIHIETELTL